MITDKFVNFLKGIQRFVRASEALLIDVISMLIPWASPLIPAYMCFNSVSSVLGFPWWVAMATASVVELLGLATINTVFEFWSFNASKNKTETSSPVKLAIVVTVFYLAIILIVNTMLDDAPIIHKVAKGLLSLLTAIGGVTIAMRSAHARRLEEYDDQRKERRQERWSLRHGQSQVAPSTNNSQIPTTSGVNTSPFVRITSPGGNGNGHI